MSNVIRIGAQWLIGLAAALLVLALSLSAIRTASWIDAGKALTAILVAHQLIQLLRQRRETDQGHAERYALSTRTIAVCIGLGVGIPVVAFWVVRAFMPR